MAELQYSITRSLGAIEVDPQREASVRLAVPAAVLVPWCTASSSVARQR